MDNNYKKIENDINSLSESERNEILNELRKEVDEIDKNLVKLLSRRTLHSVLIGRIKRSLGLPTYSPEREKDVTNKISSYAVEPLRPDAVKRIYERILDESRAIQREEANKGNSYRVMNNPGKLPFKSLLSKKELLLILFSFVILLSFFYWVFFTPNHYEGEEPKIVKITSGMNFSQITDSLFTTGIIPNKFPFKVAAIIYGAEKNIKAARYKIPNSLSYLDLLDMLLRGEGDQLRNIKLYNGISIKALPKRLTNENILADTLFTKLLFDSSFHQRIGFNYKSLEGYLLPGEYEFYEKSTSEEIITELYNSQQKFFADSLVIAIKNKGLTLHQVLIMASIIEGETNLVSEMPRIAGVYYNRLRIGMKLQADPTVQYLQDSGWKRLLYSDLKVDNPYNTYKYLGLPPGPINNPGREAILASIYPEQHKYIFFVADGTGGHKFAQTYSQHLENVKVYRKWLKNQKK